MDSITQIALGAAVGEATLGKKVGNKAPLWGAIAGTIPDLDIIPGQFMGAVEQLAFHRGFSHSIVFFILLTPLLTWLVQRFSSKNREAAFYQWSLLFFLVLLTHALLDCFTTWGTQLFWPLDYRVAIQSIFVIDPLYTLPLAVSLLVLLFYHRQSRARFWLRWVGLGISTLYLMGTLINKQIVKATFEQALANRSINYIDYRTQPAPLNNILWSATAETKKGFYIGFYSLLDEAPIDFHFVPKNHDLLDGWRNHPRLQLLLTITKGYFTVEKSEEGILINDLRFGQPLGWQKPSSAFVFRYHITRPADKNQNELQITQQEGSLETGGNLLQDYWARITGVTS